MTCVGITRRAMNVMGGVPPALKRPGERCSACWVCARIERHVRERGEGLLDHFFSDRDFPALIINQCRAMEVWLFNLCSLLLNHGALLLSLATV